MKNWIKGISFTAAAAGLWALIGKVFPFAKTYKQQREEKNKLDASIVHSSIVNSNDNVFRDYLSESLQAYEDQRFERAIDRQVREWLLDDEFEPNRIKLINPAYMMVYTIHDKESAKYKCADYNDLCFEEYKKRKSKK